MKFIFLLTICFLFLSSTAQSVKSADLILQEAYTQAEKETKNVFVIFHASWCIWCRKMDTAMNEMTTKFFFDRSYVIKHLVVKESPSNKELENPGAAELLKKYGGDELGIPYWLIFDKKGNLLADSQLSPGVNSGCPATKEEVDYFMKVLKKTSSITPEEASVIEARFRKNEE